MFEDEQLLPTRLWVSAGMRAADVQGVSMTVARKGDPDRGTVLLKLNRLDRTFEVLSQARRDGKPVWLRATGPAPVDEQTADAYIARQVKYDSDLWVVEVDDRHGRPWFDGAVLDL
jgi:hypothetical protein